MRTHMFGAGPNGGVTVTASPWEPQQYVAPPRGTVAHGPPRVWSYGLGHLQQLALAGTPKPSRRMGQKQPPPPGVCCQLDARGNTICSDGRGYPPG